MHKALIILISCTLIYSCSTADKKVPNDKKAKEQAELKQKLEGEWRLYISQYNGVDMLCNECPKVNFTSDGKLTYSQHKGSASKWSITGNNTVYIEGNDSTEAIEAGRYITELSVKDSSEELKLSRVTKQVSYILRRSK